jgi:hypothetical protein
MSRGRKKGVKGYLMSNDFNVEVQREGWERVASLLRGVEFSEFLNGYEIRLVFSETKDLDVLSFFVKWAWSKETSDIVIKISSGKRAFSFSSCWVDSVFMDGFSNLGINGKDEVVGVAVILKYSAVFVKERTA